MLFHLSFPYLYLAAAYFSFMACDAQPCTALFIFIFMTCTALHSLAQPHSIRLISICSDTPPYLVTHTASFLFKLLCTLCFYLYWDQAEPNRTKPLVSI